MSDRVPDSIKALWAIHDEPRFGGMSADDIKRRAKLLHDSDRRMRFVGPGIATLFIVFFAAAFASHETLLERAQFRVEPADDLPLLAQAPFELCLLGFQRGDLLLVGPA